MCKCTPEIRTPFCGKPGCNWPGTTPSINQEVRKGNKEMADLYQRIRSFRIEMNDQLNEIEKRLAVNMLNEE